MRISFWIDENDAFPFTLAANHIAAMQVVSYRNGAGDRVQDLEVHVNGTKFRFPYMGQNISAKLNWEEWLEGQR